MKSKIIIFVIATIIITFTITFYKNKNPATPTMPRPDKVVQAAPKKVVTQEIPKAPEPEEKKPVSISELKGPVHNKYGLRDDILTHIEHTIPHWNTKAWQAAIAIASEEQLRTYNDQTDEEAFKSSQKILNAADCLDKEFPDSNKDYYFLKEIEELMTNTKERKLHFWEVHNKHFGEKHYNYQELTKEQLNEMCEKGIYQ